MGTHAKKKDRTGKPVKRKTAPKKNAGKLQPKRKEKLQDSDFDNEYDVAYDPHKFGI